MIVLGIETSCDETAAAVVRDGRELLSNVVVSQIAIHAQYGGVVPEVAARSHLEVMIPVVEQAMQEAFGQKTENRKRKTEIADSRLLIPDSSDLWSRIDAIAVTQGPGLSGALLIGSLAARTLALIKNKPLYGVHHVLGHVYANFITDTVPVNSPKGLSVPTTNYQLPTTAPEFPVLALIVSGGHSQLVLFQSHTEYELLGQTKDDAVGEAFDKVAKIIGLPYPGGPSISKRAQEGDDVAYDFPISRLDNSYDFSFSGLKTAVLRRAQQLIGKDFAFPSYQIAEHLTEQQVSNIAASFQATAIKTLVDATTRAVHEHSPASVVIAGGVAANQRLRQELTMTLPSYDIQYAPPALCTDNAAMIAALGYYHAQYSQPDSAHDLQIRPSWSM